MVQRYTVKLPDITSMQSKIKGNQGDVYSYDVNMRFLLIREPGNKWLTGKGKYNTPHKQDDYATAVSSSFLSIRVATSQCGKWKQTRPMIHDSVYF